MEVVQTHIGAYGLIINEEKIALIKKARGGYKGKLDLPGGGIEHTEIPSETVKREIEAIIFKDDEYNSQVIKANIRKHEKELNMLRNILKETEDREFYVGKMNTVEAQITALNEKLKYSVSPDDVMMKHIEEIIDSTDLNMNEYFNQIVRAVIESVTIITEDRIKIKYVGGIEIIKSI